MAGLRRSKRQKSYNQPDQDKVPKIAKTSNDQEKVVPEKNKNTRGSAMEGPSDPGVDRASLDSSSPKDASPNRASEQQPDEGLPKNLGRKLLGEDDDPSKGEDERRKAFRKAIQDDVGYENKQIRLFKLWKKLHVQILTISKSAGFEDLPWDSLDEAAQQKFTGYSPHAQQLFETPLIRRYMFVRWIWEIIDESFFSSKSQDIEWTSPYWEAQATMERILAIEKNFCYDGESEAVQYPNWRSTTIQFYYSLEGVGEFDNRIEPGCVLKILEKGLGQYFPKNPFCKRVLSSLTETIAFLEMCFDCGRQTFRNVFHNPKTKEAYGFPFSARVEGFHGEDVMQSACGGDDATYDGRPVDLVVSPLLVVYGTDQGYDYHVAAVVFPMQVCVGYLDGFDQDEVIKTKGGGEGGGEEEVNMSKDNEGGKEDEDETKIEDKE